MKAKCLIKRRARRFMPCKIYTHKHKHHQHHHHRIFITMSTTNRYDATIHVIWNVWMTVFYFQIASFTCKSIIFIQFTIEW